MNEIYDGAAKTFSINVTEPTSDYIVYYKEGTTELTSSNYTSGTTTTPTKTAAGTTTINWYVHSNNENYSDVSGSNTLTIVALNPPTITVTSGTAGKNDWYVSNVSLSVTGNSDSVAYSISGSSTVAEQTVSNGSTISLSTEGTHNIVAYTQNNSGNKSAATNLQIKIDKTKPTINWSPDKDKSVSISKPNPNAETTQSVYFSDSISGVMHVSPGGSKTSAPTKLSDFSQTSNIYHYHWSTPKASGTWSVRFGYWTGEKNQTSTYYCWAEDAAGNKAVTSHKVTINYSK